MVRFELQQRVALVTGGGTGIGREIALALARRGARVALVGRRSAPLQATAAAIAGLGGQALALPGDVGDPRGHAAMVAAAEQALGPLSVLVHSAGVIGGGAMQGQAAAVALEVLATNLTGPMQLTLHVLRQLIARQGALVVISSTAAQVPLPGATAYGASKAGLARFAAGLHSELTAAGGCVLVATPPGAATALTAPMRQHSASRWYRPADPAAIGERIVQALEQRQSTLHWTSADRTLELLHHWLPGLTRRLLLHQRERLTRLFAATQPDEQP